jgi:hypothetical protein
MLAYFIPVKSATDNSSSASFLKSNGSFAQGLNGIHLICGTSTVIMQQWTDGESQITLIQDPDCTGIINGEKSVINGITGERGYLEASGKAPPVVQYYWKVGNMGYVLFATLTDSLDQSTVEKIITDTLK